MDNNRKINQICKPHFLGIGAARTGTTWLSHCLSKHSQVYIPPIKEFAYFGGYAQFWLDVASELYHTDTTIHSNETFLSTPFATNDMWRSRWETSCAKDFQSGPLSTLSFVNKLIR